jgi:hypothetical protein
MRRDSLVACLFVVRCWGGGKHDTLQQPLIDKNMQTMGSRAGRNRRPMLACARQRAESEASVSIVLARGQPGRPLAGVRTAIPEASECFRRQDLRASAECMERLRVRSELAA